MPIRADADEFGGLMLRSDYDAGDYLDMGVDYIATSEYARQNTAGPTARAFLAELFAENRYRMIAAAGPGFEPPLCFASGLGLTVSGDLHYVRSTFYLFERRADPGPELPGSRNYG